jgi:hypothetical protein
LVSFKASEGSGTGSGRFRNSDPDPVKIRPDLQHWIINRGFGHAQLSADLFKGLARVEEVDDGLALLHVARQPDVVELSGFFCLETDYVYIADICHIYSFYYFYWLFSVIKHRVQLYFPHTVHRKGHGIFKCCIVGSAKLILCT